MSSTITVKRHNHRIHPCDTERKAQLLEFLITQNADKSILIVTANDTDAVQSMVSGENISVVSDAALADDSALTAELVISYDLPAVAADYQTRLQRAKTHALTLLDANDQKLLYPIETLLGRTIMQELLEAFKPAGVIAAEKEAERARLEKEA